MRTPFFGQYLLSKGLIAADQLLAAVEYQNRSNSRLGELAVGRGAVTALDADAINTLQQREDLFFGEAAIKLGLMTAQQVTDLLAAQQDAHVHLGQALVALGHVEEAVLRRALTAFQQLEAAHEPEFELPQDWPGSTMAAQLFPLVPRILMRTWNFTSKADTTTHPETSLTLSDLNVRSTLIANVRGTLVVGVPYAAAHKATVNSANATRPEDHELHAAVMKLANTLGNHLTSTLAERGQRIAREPAELCPTRIPIDQGTRAVTTPYLTHVGKVVVGLVL